MYRDHRKGPGGPPGGATYPEGPCGLKLEGNQPLVGWCTPMGLPMRLGLETLGVGAPHLACGASHPPGPPPPLGIAYPRAGAPLGVLYIVGGRQGSRTLAPGAFLSLP